MINWTQAALALAEGFGLAFSPCILPILPLLLASSTTGGRTRPLQIIAGFILSFTVFSLVSRQILVATGLQQDQIQFGAFILLLAFGVFMLMPQLEGLFAQWTGSLAGKAETISSSKLTSGTFGGFIIGGLIGLVWTPCAGPILAAALLQVIQSQTNLDAFTTIFAFSIGAGLPMLAISYSGQALTQHIRRLARHATAIRRAMGVIIVVFSLFGLFGFNIGVWLTTITSNSAQSSASVTAQQKPELSGMGLIKGLDQPYPAPELGGITHWVNSEPLTIAALKGKVVLIDFWTYSCINCIRTLPYITSWYGKYKDQGLVVIGIHAPEFAFEGKADNVESAVKKFNIAYPVAMDNDFITWKNFKNQFWPAHFLIDRNGRVVYTHFGEGEYETTEHNIRVLLGLTGAVDLRSAPKPLSSLQTPETYVGLSRAEREKTDDPDETTTLPLHHWMLKGSWHHEGEYIESVQPGDNLKLHYYAKKVFLVMASADGQPKTIDVVQNGITRTITIGESKLYDIVVNDQAQEGLVTLRATMPGVRFYAFTFES